MSAMPEEVQLALLRLSDNKNFRNEDLSLLRDFLMENEAVPLNACFARIIRAIIDSGVLDNPETKEGWFRFDNFGNDLLEDLHAFDHIGLIEFDEFDSRTFRITEDGWNFFME